MSARVVDYLNPPPLAKVALTSGGTPADVDGAVEILRLVTDPAAHKKRLAELQQAVAEADRRIAEATRRELEPAKQVAELAKLRQEFDRQLEVDRANHIAKTQSAERDLVAKLDQFASLLNDSATAMGLTSAS